MPTRSYTALSTQDLRSRICASRICCLYCLSPILSLFDRSSVCIFGFIGSRFDEGLRARLTETPLARFLPPAPSSGLGRRGLSRAGLKNLSTLQVGLRSERAIRYTGSIQPECQQRVGQVVRLCRVADTFNRHDETERCGSGCMFCFFSINRIVQQN